MRLAKSSVFTTIFAITLSFTLFSSCENTSSGTATPEGVDRADKTEQTGGGIEDLGKREASNPTKYLSFQHTTRRNIKGELIVEGTIDNSASIATFKDALVVVTGFSETEAEIGAWEQTVNQVFEPNHPVPVKLKFDLPASVASIDVEIASATAAD